MTMRIPSRRVASFARAFFSSGVASLLIACGSAATGDDQAGRVVSIAVSPLAVVLAQRDTQHLAITATDAAGHIVPGAALAIVAHDSSVISVSLHDASALLTAAGRADTTTLFVSSGKVRRFVPVTVTPRPSTLLVGPTRFPSVAQGGSLQLIAVVLDAIGVPVANAPFAFVSSAPRIATVSPTGLVTSVGPAGNVTITVSSGALSQDVAFTVTPRVTLLDAWPPRGAVAPGRPMQIHVSAVDAAGNPTTAGITYESGNESVVSVSAAGVVTANGVGETTITVRGSNEFATVVVDARPTLPPARTLASSLPAPGETVGIAVGGSDTFAAVSQNFGGIRGFLSPLRSVALPSSVHGEDLAFGPSGATLYVTTYSNTLLAIDAHTGALLWTTRGGSALGMAVSPDGRTLYRGTGTVSALDLASQTITWSTDVYGAQLAVHPTRPILFANDIVSHMVEEIDATSGRVIAHHDLGPSVKGIALSKDGSTLYATLETDRPVNGALESLDLATGNVSSLFLGCRPYGVAVSPVAPEIFVTCALDGAVLAIDAAQKVVYAWLQLGGAPRRIAVSADGRSIVVANQLGRVDLIR